MNPDQIESVTDLTNRLIEKDEEIKVLRYKVEKMKKELDEIASCSLDYFEEEFQSILSSIKDSATVVSSLADLSNEAVLNLMDEDSTHEQI